MSNIIIFYHHICNWCSVQGHNVPIKKCSTCRLVSYCSIEHQKNDWATHKQLCKIVKSLPIFGGVTLFDFQGNNAKEWKQHRTHVMCYIELMLKRNLAVHERQMLLFPNVCNVCFKYNTDYYPCKSCYCTYYCCLKHLEVDFTKHKENCEQLKLCLEIDLYLRNSYARCRENFAHSDVGQFSFPTNIEKYLSKYYRFSNDYEKFMGTECLSFALTLLSSIMEVKDGTLLSQNIIIHIIGSSEYEKNILELLNIFFFWCPKLEHINILMIGPECDTSPYPVILPSYYDTTKSITINKINILYHDYLKRDDHIIPQIVVAFNCGFSEYVENEGDTWSDTIKCIFKLRNILFIITSYTKTEAEDDFARIVANNEHNTSFEVISRAKRNPFRSLKPLRDWENISKVFYLNNYVSALYIS